MPLAAPQPAPPPVRPRAFTLVELMVVVGVIGVLVAVLMPALTSARRAANRVVCLANLRSIGQAMQIYVAQHRGYIPGSGNTSGRHLWRAQGSGAATACVRADPAWNAFTNSPGPNEPNDYVFPLAEAMGLKALTAGLSGAGRYRRYLEAPQFRCPAPSDVVSTPESLGSADLGPLPPLGYVTALSFLCLPWETYPLTGSAGNGFEGNVVVPPPPSASSVGRTLPGGYVPKVTKVGAPAGKIYLADGTKRIRYATNTGDAIVGPRYVVSQDPGDTTTDRSVFTDHGAFYGGSTVYLRQSVPGNATLRPRVDGRPFAFRHGAGGGFRPSDQYLMNAVFYDGHAETLTDAQAADPALWLPRGTKLNRPSNGVGGSNVMAGVKVVWSDVRERYTGRDVWPLNSYWVVP